MNSLNYAAVLFFTISGFSFYPFMSIYIESSVSWSTEAKILLYEVLHKMLALDLNESTLIFPKY